MSLLDTPSMTNPSSDPLGTTPKDQLGAALQGAKEEAAGLASTAHDKALDKIQSGQDAVTSTLHEFAGAIRKAGEELGQHDQSMASQMVRRAAEGLEQFARAVSDKQPAELLASVREFGRTNPTVLAAGAVLAGLALGRFARSSQHHHQAEGATTGDLQPTRGSEAALGPFGPSDSTSQPEPSSVGSY